MQPYEVEIEGSESHVVGDLIEYMLKRLLALHEEVENPHSSQRMIRIYANSLINAVERLDDTFFNLLKGHKFPRSLLEELEETICIRDELLDELKVEISRTTISREKVKAILDKLAIELETYEERISVFLNLKGEYGEEVVIEEENGEEETEEEVEDTLDEEEEERDERIRSIDFAESIRELLRVYDTDDALVASAKELLRAVLMDPDNRQYLFELAVLQRERESRGEEEVWIYEQDIQISNGNRSEIGNRLAGEGIISLRRRRGTRVVHLNNPYAELMYRLIEVLNL